MSTGSEAPQQPLMLREIPTRLERRPCPSCSAQNVFLTHTVINNDARQHVECRICSMRGPVKTSEADAVEAWNGLPRDARRGDRLMDKTYEVTAYSLVERRLRVVAESEVEAIEKAKAGDYEVIDSEPAGDVFNPRWKAREQR